MLSSNFITSIIEDHKSNIWIATYSGLDKFIPSHTEKPFRQILNDSKNPVWYLAKSSFIENTIWIGTLNGLIKFDPITELQIKITLTDGHGLQFATSVSSIAEENYAGDKILWLGTYGGLVRINLDTGFKERFVQPKKLSRGY